MQVTNALPNLGVRLGRLLLGLLVLAAALAVTSTDAEASQQPDNAQSLSFTLTSSDDFVLTDTEFWSYDEATARTYFSNLQSGAPVITCAPAGRANCSPANQPTTPAAPPPIPQRLNPPVNNNKCVFFEGGTLVRVRDEFRDYKQQLTVDLGTGNQKVTWRFEWTYQVRVIRDSEGNFPTVEPRTAWILDSSEVGDGVPITASGWMAGQSTQNKTGKNARFKTSFTLLNAGAARLENAGIELLDANANVLGGVEFGLPGFPNYSVVQNDNFYYTTNAGTFGSPPGLLVSEGWVDDIQNGLKHATDGVTSDNFPGNDNQGGDRIVFGAEDPQAGEALALATVNEAGTYTVRLFGTLKGNPGEITAGFSATKTINVVSECTTS